jgi:lipid-binding SYLF domain-containing protein
MSIVFATACATAPRSSEDRATLESKAWSTVSEMNAQDPRIQGVLNNSAGYVVFPEVGKAGFIVGAGYGRGVLFEHGVPRGYVSVAQGSFGFTGGAQSVAELIVLQTPNTVADVKSGKFSLGANASAIIIRTGAAGEIHFADGVAVFAMPRGGLMVEAAVAGQRLKYDAG